MTNIADCRRKSGVQTGSSATSTTDQLSLSSENNHTYTYESYYDTIDVYILFGANSRLLPLSEKCISSLRSNELGERGCYCTFPVCPIETINESHFFSQLSVSKIHG